MLWKDYYVCGWLLLHLWWGRIITFMVDFYYIIFIGDRLLPLWLNFITFMVGITFMVDSYYISGGY